MEAMKTFWAVAYTLGLGCFAVLVLVVIPLGARDLRRLLRGLRGGGDEPATGEAVDAAEGRTPE